MDLKHPQLFGTSEKQDDYEPLFIRMMIKVSTTITMVIAYCLFIILLPVLVVLLIVHILFAAEHKREPLVYFFLYVAICVTISLSLCYYLVFKPIIGLYYFIMNRFDSSKK